MNQFHNFEIDDPRDIENVYNFCKFWFLGQKKDFPVLILRYEDLLSAPYLQIPRLLAFLGVKTNLSIASLVELTSFTNLKRLEEKGGFDEAVRQQSFFWRGKSGFAKSFIGANYKDLESSSGEIMRSFRYL